MTRIGRKGERDEPDHPLAVRESPQLRPCGASPSMSGGNLLGTQPGPVPADRCGRPSCACRFVLVGPTNRAWPEDSHIRWSAGVLRADYGPKLRPATQSHDGYGWAGPA